MAGKHEWLVVLPDAAGMLSKRMEIRPEHIANTKGPVEAGRLTLGGATLDAPIEEGKPLPLNGSVMLYQADSREEVMKMIESDVYYVNGVWDPAKIQVWPFKSAVRKEL